MREGSSRSGWSRRIRLFACLSLAVVLSSACGKPPRPPETPPAKVAAPPAPSATCAAITEPFVGTLCAPDDGKRHPGLLLFGGSQGGDPMAAYARQFAELGRVSASVRYFGVPETPPTLVRVPVETAERALRALAARSDVDPSDIAVLGTAKGGEYALLAAATYPEITSVVAIGPTPFAWFGLGEGGEPFGCSWSLDGRTLPCVPEDEAAAKALRSKWSTREALSFRMLYEASRKQADLVRAAFFPLERIRGPVLCLSGDDDRVWNSRVHCELAMKHLKQKGHAYPDRAESYPDAGHLFYVARKGPATAINELQFSSFRMAFGGTPEADTRAAQTAWPAIERFLATP